MRKWKNNIKQSFSIFLFIMVVCLTVSTSVASMTVKAAGQYNASAALAYAQAHWNDGKGKCAEFVSDCIRAGGSGSWSASATALYKSLLSSGMGQSFDLKFNSDGTIKMSDYPDKLVAGDAVFFYCPSCVSYDGKPYIHVVLCNGMDSNGYMKAYSHNGANSGQSKYRYNTNCYVHTNTLISKAVVYHFNSVDRHDFTSVIDTPNNGTAVTASTTYMAGWALDLKGVTKVTFSVNGQSEEVCSRTTRTDVQKVYPNYPKGNEGWSCNVPVSKFREGNNTVTFYAYCGGGSKHTIGSRTVTWANVPTGYSMTLDRTEIYNTDSFKVTINSYTGNIKKYYLHVLTSDGTLKGKVEVPNGNAYMVMNGWDPGTYTMYAELVSDTGSYKGSSTNGSVKITKKNMTWGSASNLGTDYWAYIQNSNTGLALTADSNGNVCGRKLTKADNQLWYLERLNDGTYRLHSKSTGKILTLYNSNYFNSGNIDAEPYTDNIFP